MAAYQASHDKSTNRSRRRRALLRRVCECGKLMGHGSMHCNACNRKLTASGGRDWRKANRCHRCGYGYDDYIPNQPGTDHCTWCDEELLLGHVVIGEELSAAGGFLQDSRPIELELFRDGPVPVRDRPRRTLRKRRRYERRTVHA